MRNTEDILPPMAQASVTIQITPESKPAIPCWMGEVAAFAQILTHTGILKQIQEQVRFTRARFGQYDLIDFVTVLIGYVLSGEPTLLAFYERLTPWADAFMALFGRDQLPHRSTLSRFLAALDQPTVEALRTRFQEDMLARTPFPSPGGLFDRTSARWLVLDVDGTRQAARQRALPQMDALPAPHRRFDQVCAPGYQGRKRGEVVRTELLCFRRIRSNFSARLVGLATGIIELDGETGQQKRTLISADAVPEGQPWRSFTFSSTDGQEIQGWLCVPEGEGPFPTILETHGGPNAVTVERFDAACQAWVDHGFAFASINYRGSTRVSAKRRRGRM